MLTVHFKALLESNDIMLAVSCC